MDMIDEVISAVGKRNFITPLGLDRVDVCIDVGINYDENGKQHGDCADAVYEMEDIKVTPRIGGVGLMTREMLLCNVCVVKYGVGQMEGVIGRRKFQFGKRQPLQSKRPQRILILDSAKYESFFKRKTVRL